LEYTCGCGLWWSPVISGKLTVHILWHLPLVYLPVASCRGEKSYFCWVQNCVFVCVNDVFSLFFFPDLCYVFFMMWKYVYCSDFSLELVNVYINVIGYYTPYLFVVYFTMVPWWFMMPHTNFIFFQTQSCTGMARSFCKMFMP